MKKLIPQTLVETIRSNGWILGFDQTISLYEQIYYSISSAQEPLFDCQSSNPQFGPLEWTLPSSYRRALKLGTFIALVRLSTDICSTLGVRTTQPVCLIHWGDNVQCFGFVFEPYGVIHLPTQLLYKEKAQQRNCHGFGVSEFLLGGTKYSPSTTTPHTVQFSNLSVEFVRGGRGSRGVLEERTDCLLTLSSRASLALRARIATTPLSDIQNSNSSPSKKCRNWGEGNGTIHWRTITRGGRDYPQAYYHWKENGRKRTKYIPKQLLGVIQEAEEQKRPVIEILKLLDVVPLNSKEELLVGIENSPSNDAEQLLTPTSKNSPSNNPRSREIPTSKNSFSKTRRNKGLGTGDIQWKTITLNGKDYPQAWYHYEEWKNGERVVKKSKYIPKRLLTRIQELEAEKAPVKEILKLLGVKL